MRQVGLTNINTEDFQKSTTHLNLRNMFSVTLHRHRRTVNRSLRGLRRSRNFRQFQHWSSGHRINWNNKITAWNYRRTQTKPRKAKKGQGWTKRGKIEMDCIWVNLKNVGPPFFKFTSVYIKMSFKQLENHSRLLCGRDSENERLLLCQFDV